MIVGIGNGRIQKDINKHSVIITAAVAEYFMKYLILMRFSALPNKNSYFTLIRVLWCDYDVELMF